MSSLQLNQPGGLNATGTPFASLPVDTKAHTFVPPKFKEAQKSTFIKSIIKRGGMQANENTVQLTVHGIYSLPEAWKGKIV